MLRCSECQQDFADDVLACPSDGTPLWPSLEGTVLDDRYRLTRTLGQGGMGRVYLAEHVLLGKQVAVKVLRQDFSAKQELVKRFQLEAVAASQIGQENIVDVTDFGQTPDRSFYYVMELVPGVSLAQLIVQGGPLPAARALPLLAQICKALVAAHARGIVHRDLKPDNVIVTLMPDDTERAKVLDFGISKVGEGPKGARITQVGMVVGTPAYMAPEQAVGSEVDLRADVYAFGVLAYEVLCGQVPFEAESPLQVLMKAQTDLPQPPSERAPALAIPVALEQLVLRCLEKKREHRPQHMGEVLAELEACMAALGVTWVSGPFRAAAGRTEPAGRALPAPVRPEPRLAPSAPPAKAKPAEPRRASTDVLPDPRFTDRRGRVVLGLLAALVAGAALWVGLAGRTPAAVPERSAVASPEPPAKVVPRALTAPAPANVPQPAPMLGRVLLSSIPAGARVLGPDRRLLGQTPLSLELGKDERRALSLEAQGYRPQARTVGGQDGRVEVRLERLPPRAAGPQRPLTPVSSPADDGYRKVDRDDIRDPYGP